MTAVVGFIGSLGLVGTLTCTGKYPKNKVLRSAMFGTILGVTQGSIFVTYAMVHEKNMPLNSQFKIIIGTSVVYGILGAISGKLNMGYETLK